MPSFRVGMKSGSSGLDDDDADLEDETEKTEKGSVNLASLLQLFPKYDGDKKEWETYEQTINGVTELFEDKPLKVFKKLGGCVRLRLDKKGRAWDHIKKNPTSRYSVRGGEQILLDDLRSICEDKPNKQTQDRMEKWEHFNRKCGQAITDFAPTLVKKKEDLERRRTSSWEA